jgi:hypothetical protein
MHGSIKEVKKFYILFGTHEKNASKRRVQSQFWVLLQKICFYFPASFYGWELDKDMTIHAGLVFHTFLLTIINFIIIAMSKKVREVLMQSQR